MLNSTRFKSQGFLLSSILLCATCAQATYSIIACDAKTRECGVAVQTNNLAVGASVPYAQAGVGALVSQFETNPNYGPQGLALLAQGKSPSDTLQLLLRQDGNFEGQGPEARQVALVSIDGRTAVHTGDEAKRSSWAGARSGPGYSIQGNGLAGPQVVDAMEQAFLKTSGTLAERLVTALTAGDLAGGQKTGRESSALLVKTTEGWPVDIDLRVDHSADPVADLGNLLDMQLARQQINQARKAARDGNLDAAKALIVAAVARASNWQRIWLQAAQVAEDIEQPDLALQYLNVAFSQNPAWVTTEIGDGNYAGLGHDPLFHRWVSAEAEHDALRDYKNLSSSRDATSAARIQVSKKLMEAGHANEALAILGAMPHGTVDEDEQVQALLADACEAEGMHQEALEHLQAVLKTDPNNQRLQIKAMRFRLGLSGSRRE